MPKYHIHPNITKAETLPSEFYKSETVFEKIKENIFTKSWHWLGDEISLIPFMQSAHPLMLLESYLSEPLVLIRDSDNQVKCFTNVCTHRGNLILHQPSKIKNLTCRYHGRRFDLDGNFKFMPAFEKVKDFPRPCDNLREFSLKKLGPHLFVGLEPDFEFTQVVKIMEERIGFLPLNEFKPEKTLDKTYLVNCHWALYCDNYLEGFHIPFVHADLNEVLDYGNYTTEIYDHVNLQIGYSNGGEEVFDLPADHIDFGKKVAAYYYWIFPNMMFNFYPWGLSINIVKPISIHKTKVSFISYVYDETKLQKGAGAMLDKVEREDEFVVEGVHKGLQSRFYKSGRFSPTMEKGVHHFHSLLAEFMNKES